VYYDIGVCDACQDQGMIERCDLQASRWWRSRGGLLPPEAVKVAVAYCASLVGGSDEASFAGPYYRKPPESLEGIPLAFVP
jgi:hypothetical protein